MPVYDKKSTHKKMPTKNTLKQPAPRRESEQFAVRHNRGIPYTFRQNAADMHFNLNNNMQALLFYLYLHHAVGSTADNGSIYANRRERRMAEQQNTQPLYEGVNIPLYGATLTDSMQSRGPGIEPQTLSPPSVETPLNSPDDTALAVNDVQLRHRYSGKIVVNKASLTGREAWRAKGLQHLFEAEKGRQREEQQAILHEVNQPRETSTQWTPAASQKTLLSSKNPEHSDVSAEEGASSDVAETQLPILSADEPFSIYRDADVKVKDVSDVKTTNTVYRPGERSILVGLKPGYMNELIHSINTHQLVKKNQTPELHKGSWLGAEAASLPKWPTKKVEDKSQSLVRNKRYFRNNLEAEIKNLPDKEARNKLELRRKETVTPKLKKISNTLLNALGEEGSISNQKTTNPGYDDPISENLFLDLESFEREERTITNLVELANMTLSPEYDPANFVNNNINFFAKEVEPHVGVVDPSTKVTITVRKSSLPIHNVKDEVDVTWSEYISGLWLPKYKKEYRSWLSKLTGGDIIKRIYVLSAKVNGKLLPSYITASISKLTLSDEFTENVSSKLIKDENFISGLALTKKYQLMASLSQYYDDNSENPIERETLDNIKGETSKVFSPVFINNDLVNNLVYLEFSDDFGGSLFSLKNVTTPYWHIPADPSGRAVLFTDDDDFMGWFTSHFEMQKQSKYLDGEGKLSLSQDFKVHRNKQTLNDISKIMALTHVIQADNDMNVLTNDINKQYKDNLIELKDYFISQLLSVASGYGSSAMYGQVSNFLKRYLLGQSLELTIQNLEGLFKVGSANNIEERNDAIMGILMGGMINAGMPIAMKGGQVVAKMAGKMKGFVKNYKFDRAKLKASVNVEPDNSFGRDLDFEYIDADAEAISLASYRHVLEDKNTDMAHLSLTKKFLNKIQAYKDNDNFKDEFIEGIRSYRTVDLSKIPDYSNAISDTEIMQRFLNADGLTPRELGALSQRAMVKLDAANIKRSLDVFYKYQEILKPGSKKILALPQIFMITASKEGSNGRCLPLVFSMAAALQRGQERNLIDNLFLGMADDKNHKWIIDSLKTLHTTSKVSPSLTNIGRNNVKNILEKLDLADEKYFSIETSKHAMLVAKVTSPQSSIPKYIFYDPNLGVFIYETRSAFENALDKTLGSPNYFDIYKAFGESNDPEYNLRDIDAKSIGDVKIHGDDTVADFSRSSARDGSSTANQQAKDYTQLAENFHHGDIIYGLDVPRKLALERLEEYGFAKHITPNKIIHHIFSPLKGKGNIRTQNDITNVVWSPLKPTSYAKTIQIYMQLYNYRRAVKFRDFLANHPNYNVADLARADAAATSSATGVSYWKKTSKAGIEYQINVLKRDVHFVVDVIGDDIKTVISKLGNGNSMTSSELRWIYRHRETEGVKKHVKFWRKGGLVDQSVIFNDPAWNEYISQKAEQHSRKSQ